LTAPHLPALTTMIAASLLGGCATTRPTTVRTSNGVNIAFSRSGTGSPTIVLQSGLGDGQNTWSSILPALERATAVFAYDRPGYGKSESTARPRDPCSIAEELHQLLQASGIAPPYLLVGHSIGGLYQYAFARRYPDDVAGLVLLDPTHPAYWKRMQRDAPAQAALIKVMRATVFRAAARREFDDQDGCVVGLESQPPLGKPIRLLTRARFSDMEHGPFERMVHSLESEWQGFLGADRIERVSGSGHYIHRDKPKAVVSAIEALLGEVRTRSANRPTASR
jgi:pimeloyl-ACP methyl ester carboxylesterase